MGQDMVPFSPSVLLPVYIAFAEGSRQRNFEYDDLLKEARNKELDPVCAPLDVLYLQRIERSLQKGYSIVDIFENIHSNSIYSFKTFWFAGRGINPYVRALLPFVYSPYMKIKVVDHTENGSILNRQLQWFKNNKELQDHKNRLRSA